MEKTSVKKKNRELGYLPADQDGYSTTDFGCSVALITLGYELVALDRSNPQRVQFMFQNENGIEEAVSAYWADRLETKTRSYFDNTKMLKQRLYE
jgi:hypothetical protein